MKGLDALNRFVNESKLEEKWDLKDIIEKEFKEGENYKVIYRLEHEKNQQLSQANLKMSKALEIIKEYPFVVNLDFRLNYNEQVDLVKEHIVQEEYDLLKEILK